MLRRLKADVEKSLPPKHETILFTGMSAVQKKLYRDILIRDIEAVHGNSGSRTAILNIVMQLRKCAGHPYLFPGTEDRSLPPLGEHLVENCGKLVVLDKLLRRLREKGHRVLLFTQMTRILDIMEDYLVMRHFPYCRIDGNTTHEDREAYIDAYNAPDSEKFIFLLSTRAGGLGINLQTADVVILYDSDWNPQADLQAQDRAHRIGQKKPVQVFRLVTEHTIEEKIVERAQQKLKLDAMVVQQGRLKDKDKLSRDELLSAVRFGADKIFKSKDSSITDDDIDLIMDAGKRRTEELNEKLKAAEKGDLLDFKFDASSAQTFEGVDYSNSKALAEAKADAELLGIFDIGKRERKEANYNENKLFQQQVAANQGPPRKRKKKSKLPKDLRLPRMQEWHMFDRPALLKIHQEEEEAFEKLPEEEQKMAHGLLKPKEEPSDIKVDGDAADEKKDDPIPFKIPQLIPEERKVEKEALLKEGFVSWSRNDYHIFVKVCAKVGRDKALEQLKVELVDKSEEQIKEFMEAFWGEKGKSRISEHEYDRVTKMVERGEKKILEIKHIEQATERFVSHFDDPWRELIFIHTNCKDKLFTVEEDRHLLCWARKVSLPRSNLGVWDLVLTFSFLLQFGYGQWQAVRFAIRANPLFRFDYFLRSLPVEQIGRRCEQLMKAAEKEYEQLEKFCREEKGLPTEEEPGRPLAPIEVPTFRTLQKQRHEKDLRKVAEDRKQREEKVRDLKSQIQDIEKQLQDLADGHFNKPTGKKGNASKVPTKKSLKRKAPSGQTNEDPEEERAGGAIGPDGSFEEFPPYDASEPPKDWKKPFTHFCIETRKAVKADLGPEERKNKDLVNTLLKEKWQALSADDKSRYRVRTEWDKKRLAHETRLFESAKKKRGKAEEVEPSSTDTSFHVPKKRKAELMIPRKK